MRKISDNLSLPDLPPRGSFQFLPPWRPGAGGSHDHSHSGKHQVDHSGMPRQKIQDSLLVRYFILSINKPRQIPRLVIVRFLKPTFRCGLFPGNSSGIENWVLVIVRYVTNAVDFPCIIFTTKKNFKVYASPVTRPLNDLDHFTV